MKHLLFILAIILIAVWFLGYFCWEQSGYIHLALVLAIIVICLLAYNGDDTEYID